MEIWEVAKPATSFNRNAPQQSHKANSVASEYSKILAAKLSNVKADVQAMAAVQEQLDDIRNMHEELTHTVKVDEDSGNANRDDDSATAQIIMTEKVRRFLPDGSIMVTTYEDGRITERVKLKPHMIVVPDYTAPPKADGSVATQLKPTNVFRQELMMM